MTPATPGAPFLKWVGGKRRLVPSLLDRMPATYPHYYEPFVGGGALFFAAQPRRAVLSDVNGPLVAAYQGVRDDVEAVIRRLRWHARQHGRDHFSWAREQLGREADPTRLANSSD